MRKPGKAELTDKAYVPAYPWSAFSNTSTYKLSYSHTESVGGLNNGFHSTMLNNTVICRQPRLSRSATNHELTGPRLAGMPRVRGRKAQHGTRRANTEHSVRAVLPNVVLERYYQRHAAGGLGAIPRKVCICRVYLALEKYDLAFALACRSSSLT